MAKDDERPQFNPKHRIAGAIILVSLAVIFVPMFLDETSPPPENQSLTEIPDRDSAETRVVVAQVDPAAETASTATLPSTQTAAAEPVTETAAVTPPLTDATPKAATVKTSNTASAPITKAVEKAGDAPKPRTVSTKPSEATERFSKGWIVQVGTFSNIENAGQLRQKLSSKGFSVDAESLTLDGKKAMRLRVGPYKDKTAASKAQAKIEKEFDIHGLVRAFP